MQLSNLGRRNNDIRWKRNLNGTVSVGRLAASRSLRNATAETCSTKCGRLVDAQLSARLTFYKFFETSDQTKYYFLFQQKRSAITVCFVILWSK